MKKRNINLSSDADLFKLTHSLLSIPLRGKELIIKHINAPKGHTVNKIEVGGEKNGKERKQKSIFPHLLLLNVRYNDKSENCIL